MKNNISKPTYLGKQYHSTNFYSLEILLKEFFCKVIDLIKKSTALISLMFQ